MALIDVIYKSESSLLPINFVELCLSHSLLLHRITTFACVPVMSTPTLGQCSAPRSRALCRSNPRSCPMEYAASWKFATMLAFGFVAAILLGML
jgi:hypothetical protein